METKTELAISVRNLTFGYTRKRVLQGVDLDVPEGQVTALVGANGAGKSTLLSILAGAEPYRARFELPWRKSAATVRVLGMDPVRDGHRVRAAVGYVPDRTDLPKWMRIRDHFALLAALYPTWDDVEAARLLAEFDLDPKQRYSELSKGQRALENLAAELAHRPRLLLLDEPFSGLDPLARRKVLDGVIAHLCEDGRTVLLVSHSIADVERCADHVALFAHGRVTRVSSVDELRATNERGDLEEALVAVAAEGRAA
jgi:ABC-2 type transport system ATP-binding protein